MEHIGIKRIEKIKDPYVKLFFKHIYYEVHQWHFGFFGVVTGLPGSGKSENSLLLAWLQDPTITEDNLHKHYFFSASDFLKNVDEANKHEWLVWDETGISFSSKNWYKLSNILIEDVIQTMRIKELGVIFVTQNIGFIDNRARALFRYFSEVRRHSLHPPTWDWRNIQVNQMLNKTYFIQPRVLYKGRYVRIKSIRLKGRLPEKLRNRFEEIHTAWKEKLIKKHRTVIEAIEKSEMGSMSIYDIVNDIQKKAMKYRRYSEKAKKWMWNKELIMFDYGIGRVKAEQIVAFLEGQGIKPEEEKKDGKS